MNLENLSYKELIELEKKIAKIKKKKENEALYKSNLNSNLTTILASRFKDDCYAKSNYEWSEDDPTHYPELASELNWKVTNALYTICDISLGNYEPKISKAHKGTWVAMRTSFIGCDPNKYKAMFEELKSVIHRYVLDYNRQNGL